MKIKLFALLACLLCSTTLRAAATDELLRLEAEMLKCFSSNDSEAFFDVAERVKKISLDVAEERSFYDAWGKEAIYTAATLKDYPSALNHCQDIMKYATETGSFYGRYASMHAKATVLLQKQDYDAAEKAFQEAVDYRHSRFPNESAAEDLQELMKIANHRKDGPAGVSYARQILNEPNVAPIHKGRALYRLSQMAFNKNDKDEFNRIYEEMMRLKESDGIATEKPLIEVNHCIMNGQFEEALRLADQLDPDISAERKAIAYHRMGDDANAFKYMQLYKRVSDSIVLVSHGNVVASCYVQMNNDRLQLEQVLLEQQNSQLRNRLYAALAIICILLLLGVVYKHMRELKRLKVNNRQLSVENKDAARALEDLAELSYYETSDELPLTSLIQVNKLCNTLTTASQKHCHRGVSMVYVTELPDDFMLKSNEDAVRKLLSYFLDNAARFNHFGTITLNSFDKGDKVQFSVSDTTPDPTQKFATRFIGLFSQEGNKLHYVGMTYKIGQSIIRLLQGTMWIDKEYVKGARLCFEIPKEPK